MNELVHIAQNVVKAVSKGLPFSISLSDEYGYIIGATDPERIGTYHPVSKKVLEHKDYISFDESDVVEFENVLPGIAVPLNFNHKTIGVLGIIGPPDKVKPHAELTKRYVELLWQDAFYRQIADLENKMIETNLQYILQNETINESQFKQCCKTLRLNKEMMSFCIVIDLDNFLLQEFDDKIYPLTAINVKELIMRDVQLNFSNNDTSIISFLNTEKVVIIQSVTNIEEYTSYMKLFKENGKKLLQCFQRYQMNSVYISAGKLTSSIRTINQSYKEANHLIQHHKNINSAQHILSYYDWEIVTDLLPYNIESNFKEKIIFRMDEWRNDKNFGELKASFIAYCENGMNISEAAKSLFIHRNTLIYRLRKLEDTLSIQTRKFQHCMLLYLILKNDGESSSYLYKLNNLPHNACDH